VKWGHSSFASKRGRAWLGALALTVVMTVQAAEPAQPLFSDDFEKHAAGQLPGAPWKEETYQSGAVIRVDGQHAFSGQQALHVFTPRGAKYRRGYVAIHLGNPLPAAQSGMFGRAMVWLDEAPVSLTPEPVHWTLLQGEGRSADDRYNAIYRLGVEQKRGTQLMANYETTPPVTTDCKQQSKRRLPVRRWACVEWHMEVASQEMEFWLDGKPVTHVARRAAADNACRGHDLGDEWRAPPKFDSLYMGFERYADSANDQNLWMDDVVLSKNRIGCPAAKQKGVR
jgi:polysaccharide lyase-like protein